MPVISSGVASGLGSRLASAVATGGSAVSCVDAAAELELSGAGGGETTTVTRGGGLGAGGAWAHPASAPSAPSRQAVRVARSAPFTITNVRTLVEEQQKRQNPVPRGSGTAKLRA